MAVMLEGGCRVSHMHEGETVVEGSLSLWRQIGRATGARAISLSVMELAPGLSPTIHNNQCDQILYVVEQSGSNNHPDSFVAATLFIGNQSFGINGDTGVYIRPNQTFAVNNTGSKPLTIISSQCPDPALEPKITNAPVATNSAVVDMVPIIHLVDQKTEATADRWYRVLIDKRVGSEQVTQFVGSIPPGRAPDHFHHYEEVLFILEGEGRLWTGEMNTPIGVGSCIYLPKGQVHCVENTGTGELRLLGVFYPAGSPSVSYDV